jgi:hypothetical protein
MIKNRACEAPEKLVFETTPPYLDQTSHGRFRGQRNLPYRDAEPYKASIYYWWWAFLKRNKQYQRTCLKRGKAQFCQVYHDFGNIFEFEFKAWWETRKFLFSEQSALIEKRNMDAARDGLLYRIDPGRSFNQIQQEIKAIHMQAHAIMPANSQRRRSSAKYPIYVNASAYNLYRVLKVWDLRCEHPDMSAYDVGIMAGLKPNILPPSRFGHTRTRSAIAIERHNKRAHISIANQSNRYLRTAEQYIDNVGRGEFPKALRR